jgi:dihydrodipicolinate synthase/N-acetylneuraminate lyase
MTAAQSLQGLPELTAQQAEHWVAAALAEARALQQHDQQLFPSTGDQTSLRAAQHLHDAWKRWADDAEALYERIRPLLRARQHVAGAHDLDYAIGRARATVRIAPAEMLDREQRAQSGDVKTIEEVRRELRAADRG